MEKVQPKPDILLSITSSVQTDSVIYLELSRPYWAHQAIIMVSKDPKMGKQGTAGKRNMQLMTLQELEIIRRLESSEDQREVMAS